jgi:hypothetical protein
VIAEGTERTLLTVWQSEAHYTSNKVLLTNAVNIVANPTFERRGYQGQAWSKDAQQSWLQYACTWPFYVNFLAACGVIGGLYAFFHPIVDYLVVPPWHSADSPEAIHEVVEGYPSTLSVQIRSDVFSGTCDMELSDAYLTGADGKYTPGALPTVRIASTKKIGNIKCGESTPVSLELPQLDTGQYRLFVKMRQDAGLVWRLAGAGNDHLEVRNVRVIRLLDVEEPKEMEVLKERNGKVNARYHLRVTPGIDCSSITGRLTLESENASMTSALGIDFKKQVFDGDTKGLSGIEWTVRNAKAKQTIIVPVVVEGVPGTDWNEIRKHITPITPSYIKKE